MALLRCPARAALLAAVVSVLVAFPAGADQQAAYVIGPGDVLEIQVWDNKALDQTVFVRPDGKISLPLVGEIQAGGLTVRQFQDALVEAYTRTVKAASVTVMVKEIRSRPVYFVGGFVKPGVEQITRDLSLMQAIAVVGGLVPAADGENAYVVRDGRRIPVDLTRLVQKGDVSQNLALQVGDTVVVPIADAVYVQGEVKNPGPVKSTADLTVLKAISQAGGLTPLAAAGRVEILRGDGDTRERIKVDLDKMRGAPGANPDLRLKANDIVFVPQRLF
jgi:polysaccharide export outer membrane protein